MRKLYTGLLSLTLTTVLAFAPANAADMYGGLKDDAYVPVTSWAGFYVGVHGGYAWGDTTGRDALATNGSPWNKLGDTFTADAKGGLGGAHIGYSYQRSSIVFGLESDIGWLGATGTGTSNLSSDTHVKSDGGFYMTARGRVGYALGNTLFYGTGGLFGADLQSKVFDNIGSTVTTSDAGFQVGWTAGGGIEHMFGGGWSIKAEYLYYDLGSTQVGGRCCGGGVIQNFEIENTGNLVRAGITKHFGTDYVPLK